MALSGRTMAIPRALRPTSGSLQSRKHTTEGMADSPSTSSVSARPRRYTEIAELVVPVFLRDQHLISILAGTFRYPGGVPENAKLPEWFYEEYEKLPELDQVKLEKLSNLLRIVGNGMVMWKELQVTAGAQSDRKLLIYQFVEDHSHEAVSLADLGQVMGVSPSRARHLVKELTNRSFKALLNEERMIRARYLLESTIHSLQYIAETVGFKNEFYFI